MIDKREIGFVEPGGYVQLPGMSLAKNSILSVNFKTTKPDGLILHQAHDDKGGGCYRGFSDMLRIFDDLFVYSFDFLIFGTAGRDGTWYSSAFLQPFVMS